MRNMLNKVIKTLISLAMIVVLVCVVIGSIRITIDLVYSFGAIEFFSSVFVANVFMTLLQMILMLICSVICLLLVYSIYKIWKVDERKNISSPQ